MNVKLSNELNTAADKIDLTPELSKLTMPALILRGKYDANIALSSAQNIHQNIPRSQLTIFTESGHLPFYEEPDTFVKVIGDFLSR